MLKFHTLQHNELIYVMHSADNSGRLNKGLNLEVEILYK